MPQDQVACPECQNHRDDDLQRASWRSVGEASCTCARNRHEPCTDSDHDQSTERFEHHIPMPRQEKRWHEMPVQKPLIREDGACEECCTGESDNELRNHTCGQVFECLRHARRRHASQETHLEVLMPFPMEGAFLSSQRIVKRLPTGKSFGSMDRFMNKL